MLVVGHGSRDADGVEEFWALAATIRAAADELTVGFGFIELASPIVDDDIDALVAQGATEIVIVSLVLYSVVLLKNDGTAALKLDGDRQPRVTFCQAHDLC